MNKFRYKWYWIFTRIVLLSITLAHDEICLLPVSGMVHLSDTEVLYLNECLQSKEYMSREDALNTIIELEHFYTLIKNDYNGIWTPSAMVDQAWHHHILNTQMYNTFSRQHFGREILRHIPFWSGNKQSMQTISDEDEDHRLIKQYNTMVAMFGLENVNKTVWFLTEDELHRLLLKRAAH